MILQAQPARRQAPTDQISGIDGLRAIAVASIIIYHLNSRFLPGGFVGVDIFYVISGFVVARSAQSLPTETLHQYCAAFYRRRILRIFPAVGLFVVTMLAFCIFFVPFSIETRTFEAVGLSALVAASNFSIYLLSNNYFDAAASFQPFLHTWSLAVEEQYYILFPFFSFYMFAGSRSCGRKRVRGFVAAAVILSLLACALIGRKYPEIAFYMMPTRFWELGIGLFLCVWLSRIDLENSRASTGLMLAATLIASVLGLIVALLWADERKFPFPWALLPCLATAGLIAVVVLNEKGIASRLLSLRPAVWIGKLSYSLYLWHWGVIAALRWTLGFETPLVQIAAVVLTISFSTISYYLVEHPIRYSLRLKQIATRRFALGFAGCLVVLLAFGGCLSLAKPVLSLSATRDFAVWRGNYFDDVKGVCDVKVTKVFFRGGSNVVFTPTGCAKRQTHTLFVAGDSHALIYGRVFYRLAAQEGYWVRNYTLGACPFLPGKIEEQHACVAFRRSAREAILNASKPGDLLLLPALWTQPYRDNWNIAVRSSQKNHNMIAPTDANLTEVRRFLSPFLAKPLRIIIEGPKPVITTANFRCSDWFNRSNSYCRSGFSVSRAEELKRSNDALRYLVAVSHLSPSINFWSVFDVLCSGASCPAFRDGKPLYIDTHHLSAFGDDLIYPYMKAELDASLQSE